MCCGAIAALERVVCACFFTYASASAIDIICCGCGNGLKQEGPFQIKISDALINDDGIGITGRTDTDDDEVVAVAEVGFIVKNDDSAF